MSPVPVVGDRVGDWLLLEWLGAGGMGVVFRAQHASTRRIAAVKILTSIDALEAPQAAARMRNEARILKRLAHPNIAEYLDYIDHRGTPSVAMRYVAGPTLAQHLARGGPLAEAAATTLLAELAAAVAYLHAEGIVHRDLKAENVKLAPDGHAVLLDFGIARDQRSAALTRTHAVVGTLGCLAPELLDGAPASSRSDVWALGILFLQMLSGRAPFASTGVTEIRAQQRKGWRAQAPSNVGSRKTAALLDRCLAHNPSRRFADASALAAAIASADGVAPRFAAASPMLAALKARVLARAPTLAARSWIAPGFVVLGVVAVALASRAVVPPRPPANDLPPPDTKGFVAQQDAVLPPMADVLVDTWGGSAEVRANGTVIGHTPFRTRLPVGEKVKLELHRAGSQPQPVEFEVLPVENRYDIRLLPTP